MAEYSCKRSIHQSEHTLDGSRSDLGIYLDPPQEEAQSLFTIAMESCHPGRAEMKQALEPPVKKGIMGILKRAGIVVSRNLPFPSGDIAVKAVVSEEFATGLPHFQKSLWGATSSPSSSGKGPATRMGFCPALKTVRHGMFIVGLFLLAPVSFFNVDSSTP